MNISGTIDPTGRVVPTNFSKQPMQIGWIAGIS